jgi:hypothetical protein
VVVGERMREKRKKKEEDKVSVGPTTNVISTNNTA